MVESAPQPSFEHSTSPEMEYRSVEPWAVGGLLLGLVSPASLLAPLLWLVPPLAILANSIALVRLRDGSRTGRGLALAGLGLSVVFAVAPAAEMVSAFLLLKGQARGTADLFLEYLTHDSPEKAMILRTLPEFRQLDDPWAYFRYNNEVKADLKKFVQLPLVRTLLALDGKAQVRFYKLAGIGFSGSTAQVIYWYTVTYEYGGAKQTFVVGLVLERKPSPKPEVSPWRVKEFYGPVDINKVG